MAAYATTAAISAETASWQAAAEQLASQVLELAGFQEGPIDAFQLARKLGYHVIYDQKQAGRGRLKQIAGRTTIFLRPQDRPERMHWALCHEVGETLVWRLFEQVNADPRDEPAVLREQAANLLATRLLLPESRFFSAVQDSQGDLLELKQQFPTASFELISLRLLDRPDPRCVTIIDQGRISKRRSNTEARPGPLLEPEALCWEESHEQAKFSERSSDTMWVRCWPIHEEQWKREIILTQPRENEFA